MCCECCYQHVIAALSSMQPPLCIPTQRNSPSHVTVQVGVSHGNLNKLYTITHEKGKQQGKCLDDTCTVCQEEYAGHDTIMQLPCKHWFHQECISTWLHESKMCPVCMAEVGAVDGKQETEAGTRSEPGLA
jgi:hypothetical protein